jgi:hypothetical protein
MLPPRTARARSVRALVAGTAGIALAYASGFAPPSLAQGGPWLMAVCVPVVLVATMALGAAGRDGGLRGLGVPFVGLTVWLAAGFLLALGLPVEPARAPLVFGLPVRAALVLYGVGAVPLVVLPFVYAWAADRGHRRDDA